MRRVSVSEAGSKFGEYVDLVANRGERFVITRDGEPVAELRPVMRGVPVRDIPGIFASLPRLTPREAEEFGRDIDAAREELRSLEPRTPWDS